MLRRRYATPGQHRSATPPHPVRVAGRIAPECIVLVASDQDRRQQVAPLDLGDAAADRVPSRR